MRNHNFARMMSLVAALPATYEKKEVATDPKAEILGEIKSVASDLKEMRREFEEVKAAGKDSPDLKAELEKAHKRMDQIEGQLQRPDASRSFTDMKAGNIGRDVVESDEMKSWRESTRSARTGRRFSFRMEKSFFPDSGLKAVLTNAGVPNMNPMVVPGIVDPFVRELRIRDLMTVLPTTARTIEYLKETSFTNSASPQVEGEAKAQSDITFDDAEAVVRTIAHWTEASKQVLDDNAGLEAYINGRMTYGLKLKEEEEILSGSGTGEHLNGIITQATAYSTAYTETGDTEIDMILNGMTQLRIAEAPVEGWVMHPRDWARVQKVKTEDGGAGKGSYVFGNPSAAPFQVASLWGRPGVITTAITAGYWLVGAFRMFATIYDRQEATIDISTEHSDFFVKNKVAIRAEERIALVVTRPQAFVYGAF